MENNVDQATRPKTISERRAPYRCAVLRATLNNGSCHCLFLWRPSFDIGEGPRSRSFSFGCFFFAFFLAYKILLHSYGFIIGLSCVRCLPRASLRVSLDLTGLYWVLLDLTGFYLVFLGFTGFLPSFLELN